jgi:hypothetical protein
MQKDVFVSYSTPDRALANSICGALEHRGIACWIAPRDVPPGAVFDEAILDAIETSAAMVLVLSNNANQSPFVKNEVNRAFANGRTIFTFRIEDVPPGRGLEFYLARHHWTDGFPPPLDEPLERLSRAILALLGRQDPATRPQQQTAVGDEAVSGAAVFSDKPSESTSPTSASRSTYRYISANRAYLLPKPERVTVFHGIGLQTLGWGERVQVLGTAADYIHVRAYSGREGYLWPQWLQEADPKAYFDGNVSGEHHTGFLCGLLGDDDPSRLLLKQTRGDHYFPICQVHGLQITPQLIRVTDMDGGVIDVDDVMARFVVGPMPSIRSGIGHDVSLARNVSESMPFLVEIG